MSSKTISKPGPTSFKSQSNVFNNTEKGSDKVAKTKTTMSPKQGRKSRPALNPETRENQLVALAVDLAEQQLRDGTASSQVITHYLKLGTMKERQEREKLEQEIKLLKAKTEAIESAKHIEELYADAIKAMQSYSGNGDQYD